MAVVLDGLDVEPVWLIIGDWLVETGDNWDGFEAESEKVVGAFWLATGDLHLVAQGKETGEVVVNV